jgi:hypothetical protein
MINRPRAIQWVATAIESERRRACAICDEVASWYPADVFPPQGDSVDCRSARMARLTCENIKNYILGIVDAPQEGRKVGRNVVPKGTAGLPRV